MKLKPILKRVGRVLWDMLDPVCQNPNAVILGDHRGYCVRLVPVVGKDGHIDAWVPDPDKAQDIDRVIDSGLAPDLTLCAKAPVAMPTAPGARPTTQPPPGNSAPPILPPAPSFNPAGVPGI